MKHRPTLAGRAGAVAATGTAAVGIALLVGRVVRRRQGELSGFRSPEAKRRYLDAYDDVLAQWPVPYQELTIPTPFGDTHVVSSGDTNSPPLVLLHATGTSSTDGCRISDRSAAATGSLPSISSARPESPSRRDCFETARTVCNGSRRSLTGSDFNASTWPAGHSVDGQPSPSPSTNRSTSTRPCSLHHLVLLPHTPRRSCSSSRSGRTYRWARPEASRCA